MEEKHILIIQFKTSTKEEENILVNFLKNYPGKIEKILYTGGKNE
jgi:hypothetical protein